ncbi:hypothetical protein G3I32_39355 [Streptomyces coelicoflavus]|uniref:DUF1795 domain-containing protein n=1 Tax=Streptomyces coelicoflavus TaxID=285562 RepID=A0A7K3PXZ8_9ACTN|nr:hypothetical protein [Streptomyces coelicoflavus]
MPHNLPIPLSFKLPDGWQPATPRSEFADEDVAFAAVRSLPKADFVSNITIDGELLPDTVNLNLLADESVRRLIEVAESVVVTDRREVFSDAAPALIQVLSFSAIAGGVRRKLVQSQMFLVMVDVKDSRRRVAIRTVLTTDVNQYASVVPEYQIFLRSIRADTL